ncbi:MAG: hypothetical protein ACP5KY_08015, partial [Thermoproteus sp.]
MVRYYGVDIDVDSEGRGAPSLGIIVKFTGWLSQSVARYEVQTFVAARQASQPTNPLSFADIAEFYVAWKDTYFVANVDPWYKVKSVTVDGTQVIYPSDACVDRGDCKIILPMPTKAPSDPLSSTYSWMEKLWPWSVGSRAVVASYEVLIEVDKSVVVGTAPTTLWLPELTLTGGRTVTATNPTTVVLTELRTVTRTLYLTSVRYEYITTTLGGQTVTATTWITLGQTYTLTLPGRQYTTTTTVVKPGETVVKTVVVERTVTAPGPGGPSLCDVFPDICKWLESPALLIVALAFLALAAGLALATL